MVLDGARQRLRLPDPLDDYDKDDRRAAADRAATRRSCWSTSARPANTAAEDDWCPACGERNAIRYLGTGAAALAAASVTQLFTGGELDEKLREDKTLMFNDSVQDAAHRAGFVANRSYTFSLRALLAKHLTRGAADRAQRPDRRRGRGDHRSGDTGRGGAAGPARLQGVDRLLSGQGRGGDLQTWRLIGERLAFEAVMEFGFRSRNGRTLELTRTAAAQVRIADPRRRSSWCKRHPRGVRRDGAR